MSKPLPVESMNQIGLKHALSLSRRWLNRYWETADMQLLHAKLLRHAEMLEALK